VEFREVGESHGERTGVAEGHRGVDDKHGPYARILPGVLQPRPYPREQRVLRLGRGWFAWLRRDCAIGRAVIGRAVLRVLVDGRFSERSDS
jgi:hypothetical protein